MKIKHLLFIVAFVLASTTPALAITAVQIFNGGTGTSTAPAYGSVLIGGPNGEYEFVASSTLGGGLQTPWKSTIDAAGHALNDAGAITSTNFIATSTTLASQFQNASTTNLSNTGYAYFSQGAYPNVQIGQIDASPAFELNLDSTNESNYASMGVTNGGVTGGMIADNNPSDTFNGQAFYIWTGNKSYHPYTFGFNGENNCGLYSDNTDDTLFDCYPPKAAWGTGNEEMSFTGSLPLANGVTDWTDYTNMQYGGSAPTGPESSLNISSTATTSLAAQTETFEMKFWYPALFGPSSNASSTTPFFVASSSLGAVAVGWPTVQSTETTNQRGSDYGLRGSNGVFQVIGSSTDPVVMTVTSGSTTQASSIKFEVQSSGASTTNLTDSGSAWLTGGTASSLLALDSNKMVVGTTSIGTNLLLGPASSLLAFNSSGAAIATTSIGYNYITGGPTGANPTATMGLTAVNGSATTFMRSDAAPALSQAITPTWTGLHTFNTGGILDTASSTFDGGVTFTTSTTTNATTTNLGFTNLNDALLSTNHTGQVVATSSIGANYITGVLGTINTTSFSRGSSITITAASSSLLGDNSTFAGNNIFSASTTFANLINVRNSSTSLASISGTLWDTPLGTAAGTFLAADPNGQVIATTSPVLSLTNGTGIACSVNGTSHTGSCSFANQSGNTFLVNQASGNGVPVGVSSSTIAAGIFGTGSTNQIATWGASAPGWSSNLNITNATSASLYVTGVKNAVLSTDANGQVVASTSIGTNLLTGVLGTINSTSFSRGGAITITAASSTLLGDNNAFSGTTALATTTIGSLNGVIYVDGIHYPKTGAGLAAAVSACTALSFTSCSSVHLTTGTTTLDRQITIPAYMTISGDGWGSILEYTNSSVELYINDTGPTILENFTADQSDVTSGSPGSDFVVYSQNASDLLIDHVRVRNAYGFGIFTNTTANTGLAQRIIIQNSFLNGTGNADVIGGGPTDSTSTVRNVTIRNNTVIQDASMGAHYDGGIDMVRANQYNFTGNNVQGFVVFGSEQFPHTRSIAEDNIVTTAIGATCTKIGFNTDSSTTSSSELLLNSNTITHGYLEVQDASANGVVDVTGDGNTIDATGCSYGVLINNVNGGTFSGFTEANATDGVYMDNSSHVQVTGVVHNNTLGVLSTGTSNHNTYNILNYSNGTNYSLSDTDSSTDIKGGLTVEPSNSNSSALWVGTSTQQVAVNSAYAPGDTSLFVSRSAGEGDPTVSGGTVARFQSNGAAGYSAQIGVVSGTTGNASVYFGNKNNDAAGILAWSNANNTFDLVGGNVGVNTTNAQQAFEVNSGTNYQGILLHGSAAPNIGFALNGNTTPVWKVGISGNNGSDLSISSGASNTDVMNFLGSNVGISTTTPGSIFSIGVSGNASGINFSLATSTFENAGGINLTTGCFAINGTCITGGGSASSTLLSDNNTFSGTNTFSGSVLNVGSGSPQWTLTASNTLPQNTNGLTFTSAGQNTPDFVLQTTGNAGFGTTTPATGVDIADGDLSIESSGGLRLYSNNYQAFSKINFNSSVNEVFTTWPYAFDNGGISTGAAFQGIAPPSGGILSQGQMAIATSTLGWGELTIATSSRPQISLSDGTPSDAEFYMRTAGGYLWMGTSTAAATSSTPSLGFDSAGDSFFGTTTPTVDGSGITDFASFVDPKQDSHDAIVSFQNTNSGNAIFQKLIANSNYAQESFVMNSNRWNIGGVQGDNNFYIRDDWNGYNTVQLGFGATTSALWIDSKSHVSFGGSNFAGTSVSSCGGSPKISGSDTEGTITTGTSDGLSCTASFAQSFTNIPRCFVNLEAATSTNVTCTPTTSGFTINWEAPTSTVNNITSGKKIDYWIIASSTSAL